MDLVDLDRVLDEFEAKERLDQENVSVLSKKLFQPLTHSDEGTSKNGLDIAQPHGNGVQKLLEIDPKLIELGDTVLAPLPVPSIAEIPSTNVNSIDSLLFSDNGPVMSSDIAPVENLSSRQPDVTNHIIDQEPEDPKSSSPPAESIMIVENSSDQQPPPPDVVAGHQLLNSRSSTPSPTPAPNQRPIGFYDNGDQLNTNDHVSEEELERYLSELEQKIGYSSSTLLPDDDDEPQSKTPSSEELKTYLAELEKISGNSVNGESGIIQECVAAENDESSVAIISKPPEKASAISSDSKLEDNTAVDTSVDRRPVALPQTADGDVMLDNRSRFHPVEDDELEEDPYVMLAFSSTADGENATTSGGLKLTSNDLQGQDLKTEIEQALLASKESGDTEEWSNSAKDIQAIPMEEPIELSGDSFEICADPDVNILSSDVTQEHSGVDSEATVQETAVEGMEASGTITDGADSDEKETSSQEPAANQPAAASTAIKGQLVTVCRMDALPSENLESASAAGLLKLTESELQLGRVQPVWIPDQDSVVCMLCESKFTLIRRRHHCRACGRVLCNVCCNQRAKLPYMASASTAAAESAKQRQPQEARVCNSCHDRLIRIEDLEKQLTNQAQGESQQSADGQQAGSNAVNISSSSAIAAIAGASAATSSPPPRPPVLKREGFGVRRRESKQVMFSDGIKPGGDLTETPPSTVITPSQSTPSTTQSGSTTPKMSAAATSIGKSINCSKSIRARELESYFARPGSAETSEQAADVNQWPPILDDKGEILYLDEEGISKKIVEASTHSVDGLQHVDFCLKRNLRVHVRLAQLDCCLRRAVWCFASDGLRNVSQDEIMIVIERGMNTETQETEKMPPLDVFVYLDILYDEALKGKPIGDLSYVVFSQLGMNPAGATGYFDSKDNAGILHFRPTYQCLQNLCLPEHPFLIGVLIQKSEVSWAKVMPLRLLLRMGVEYRYYPYPISSDRYRKPLFYETGHTIMNLLTDMRSFTYTLPSVVGCTVALEDEKTIIQIPMDQYNQVLKILQSSNEHVLAWAASLHKSADAHLVCVQQSDTLTYASQTINRENRRRKLTGACFVVFNASLKASGPTSRISIVEDGLMIQIRADAMERLRQCLHQQQSFDLIPQTTAAEGTDQNANVEIRWIPTAEKMNRFALKSYIDGRILTDAPRYRLHGKTVESSNGRNLIRLIELYLMKDDEDSSAGTQGEPEDLQSMVRQVANACGTALLPFVDILTDARMRTISARFAMGADLVEYSVGSNEQPLPDELMSAVDDTLIPLLHGRAMGGESNESNSRLWRVELVMRLLDL